MIPGLFNKHFNEVPCYAGKTSACRLLSRPIPDRLTKWCSTRSHNKTRGCINTDCPRIAPRNYSRHRNFSFAGRTMSHNHRKIFSILWIAVKIGQMQVIIVAIRTNIGNINVITAIGFVERRRIAIIFLRDGMPDTRIMPSGMTFRRPHDRHHGKEG